LSAAAGAAGQEQAHESAYSHSVVRHLGSNDVVSAEFIRLAIETNLIDSNGRWTGDDVRKSVRRYGREDVEHVIR
jgi:hypothetical protein